MSEPNVVVEFAPCLDTIWQGLESRARDYLNDKLSNAESGNSRLFPDASARALCRTDLGSQLLAIWLRGPSGPADDSDRAQRMQTMRLRSGTEEFAVSINSATFQFVVGLVYGLMLPMRLNDEGKEDPEGPIHVTDCSIDLMPPDKVITTLSGFDDRPFPDAKFKVTSTDTLSVRSGELIRQSSTITTVDTSVYYVLSLSLSPLPLLSAPFLIEGLVIDSLTPRPSAAAGIVGVLINYLTERTIEIPRGSVTPSFRNVRVTDNAVKLGGLLPVNIGPLSVEIAGNPSFIVSEEQSSLIVDYQVRIFRQVYPLTFQWTVDGGTIRNPESSRATIEFDLSDLNIGESVTKVLKVKIQENAPAGEEAQTARDELNVLIKRPRIPRPMPEPE